ncbi:MAG: Plug domain-containing protein, partial [Gammaproteobacteria bacterium]|nr:Plug domain-containing protein [Gammaproteobacteria bacterium]
MEFSAGLQPVAYFVSAINNNKYKVIEMLFAQKRTLLATALLACTAQIAYAEVTESAVNNESTSRRILEEVVVSAQKVEQSSQDVPISLTAVSGDFMREVGATGLQDIAPYIPNVRFSSDTDPALAQINIRGFGSNPLNSAFDSSVGFVQDEIFFNRPSYYNEAMFDIARVEKGLGDATLPLEDKLYLLQEMRGKIQKALITKA